jgi:hypothetical protein
MTLPTHDVITADEVLDLLDAAVEARGAKHRYPAKPGRANKVEPFYGEPMSQAVVDGPINGRTPEQDQDFRESVACHYFATERDAGLVKGVEVGAPMCIVGFVLDALGMEVTDLVPQHNIGSGINAVALDLNLPFDDRAITVLEVAQEQQDGGLTWGDAVKHAREFAERTAEE